MRITKWWGKGSKEKCIVGIFASKKKKKKEYTAFERENDWSQLKSASMLSRKVDWKWKRTKRPSVRWVQPPLSYSLFCFTCSTSSLNMLHFCLLVQHTGLFQFHSGLSRSTCRSIMYRRTHCSRCNSFLLHPLMLCPWWIEMEQICSRCGDLSFFLGCFF